MNAKSSISKRGSASLTNSQISSSRYVVIFIYLLFVESYFNEINRFRGANKSRQTVNRDETPINVFHIRLRRTNIFIYSRLVYGF